MCHPPSPHVPYLLEGTSDVEMKREGTTTTLFGVGDSTVSGSVVVSQPKRPPSASPRCHREDASKPPDGLRPFCSMSDVSSSGPGHVKSGPTQRVRGLTHRRKIVGFATVSTLKKWANPMVG